jgi:septum formation protein
MKRKLILASGSLRRKELLEKAGLHFEIIISDYEEDMALPLSPDELVKHLSRGKAETVAKEHKDAIVLSADTIVAYDSQILGKPHTEEKAEKMLQLLSGKQHSVFTGFTVMLLEENKIISRAIETKVYFNRLSDDEIKKYVATGDPLEKAGAYAIQKIGEAFVEKIEGDYNNVVGLPIDDVLAVLRGDFGLESA